MAEIRPVFDAAVVEEHDVLQPVAVQVGEPHVRIAELHVRKILQPLARHRVHPAPAGARVVEEVLEIRAGVQRIGDAVAVQIQ